MGDGHRRPARRWGYGRACDAQRRRSGRWLGGTGAEATARPRGDLGRPGRGLPRALDTEWALPTECPGWDVKDQLSHLIGVERAHHGRAGAGLGRAPRRPREERLRRQQRALDRRAPALPGPDVRAEFVEVTRTRLAQLAASPRTVGGRRLEPRRRAPHAVFMEVRVFDSWVHEQDVRRALDRPGGSGNQASAISLDRVQGAMPFVVGKRAGCPDGTAVRFDVAGPGATPAPSPSPSRAGGPGMSRRRRADASPCRSRASTSSGSAAAGSRRRRWRPRRGRPEGDAAVGAPCSPP